MKILFLIFLIVPMTEIYFLIEVGSEIGAGLTILLIIGTALLGAILVRAQGFTTYLRMQKQLANGEMPALEILEGMFLLCAGALLLIPGFVTDAIGFLILTPPVRRWMIRWLLRSGRLQGSATVHSTGTTSRGSYQRQQDNGVEHKGNIIDAEYQDLDK